MLERALDARLSQPVRPEITLAARRLAADLGGDAVLFYGSNLRRGDLEGVVDFYVLRRRPARGISAVIWPDVGYHEIPVDGQTVRAKVAVMSLGQFRRAAAGRGIDTTIWTRFCQPARLLMASDGAMHKAVVAGLADAMATAARFALALGPATGQAQDWWLALFRETYRAELRVERQSRADSVLAADPEHYRTLLPLAWEWLGVPFTRTGETFVPQVDPQRLAAWRRAWALRRALGRPLNVVRLIKAAFTFAGATRYALWKIERHSGIHIPLTPWREKHPILAAPAVLARLWLARRQDKAPRQA